MTEHKASANAPAATQYRHLRLFELTEEDIVMESTVWLEGARHTVFLSSEPPHTRKPLSMTSQ
ncbi:uncharacterized protein EI90DRAFT_3065615 [Cantharellus anzutake]|uniref:uncharacterized protein n=1 Tax=Cantharellus anzutake TaxID=1750568 RepID=UPI001903464E|nr:uncharacterized protein EI90DRAFT_3065615 [Cantharellus anzutake]KAF8328105.1 hypothetical protein EI90DRAFT_3065615 [Cantharellus anzutake]